MGNRTSSPFGVKAISFWWIEMRGLFLKSVIIICVTVVGSVVAMTLILNAFQASPVISQLEQQKREVVLDLTQAILHEDGLDAAMRFAATSEAAMPLGLTISREPDTVCETGQASQTRAILLGDSCVRIAVQPPEHQIPFRFAPIMLGVALLASSILAAAVLARTLVSPILLLRDGLSALAQGRFDVRIAERLAWRKDEIAGLSKDFDRTAARLQDHQEAQQRLFHDVSHELRSPLSRLQAVTGVLRKSPAKLPTMLDRMDREVERLDLLVGEVLTLARLSEQPEAPLQTQRLDVIEILNDILADAAFEAQERQVTVTTDVAGTFIADVDGELIYRALENVIRKATKYTAETSTVSVACAFAAEYLTVEVRDRGPGVGSDEIERIFQPFSRGADAMPRGGYGLGLAIARQAVERHGGSVEAHLPENGGLAVTVRIPQNPGSQKSGTS